MTVKTEVGEGEGTLIVRTVAETRDAAEHPRAHRKPPTNAIQPNKATVPRPRSTGLA